MLFSWGRMIKSSYLFQEYCGVSALKIAFETKVLMWSEGTYRNNSIRSSMCVYD